MTADDQFDYYDVTLLNVGKNVTLGNRTTTAEVMFNPATLVETEGLKWLETYDVEIAAFSVQGQKVTEILQIVWESDPTQPVIKSIRQASSDTYVLDWTVSEDRGNNGITATFYIKNYKYECPEVTGLVDQTCSLSRTLLLKEPYSFEHGETICVKITLLNRLGKAVGSGCGDQIAIYGLQAES